jgi:uncharacterized protein YbjQ (UPF0145 family)
MSEERVISRIKNYLINKRWGIVAILIGAAAGLISAFICVKGNIAIFGFNISFIISPLIAGYVETYVSQKKYGKTTGAISAILIFFLINIVAWVFPAEPITLNILTLGGLGLFVQAAFPIFINYLLFVVFLGTLTYVIGYLGTIISKATFKITGNEKYSEESLDDLGELESIDLEKFNVIATTTSIIPGKKISENLGTIEGFHIFKPHTKDISKRKTDLENLKIFHQMEFARKTALARIMEATNEKGANGVVDVEIDYTDIGGITGNEILVNISGTAIKFE